MVTHEFFSQGQALYIIKTHEQIIKLTLYNVLFILLNDRLMTEIDG